MSLNMVSCPTFLVNIAMIGNTVVIHNPLDWSNQLRQNNKSLEKTSHQNIYIYYLTIDMQQSLVSKERISEVLGKKEYKKKEVLGVCLFLSQSISIPCLCMFLLIKCNIGLR